MGVLETFGNSTDMLSLVKNYNNAVDGYFSPFLLMTFFFIIFFALQRRFPSLPSLLISSFTTTILSIVMNVLGLVDIYTIYILGIITGALLLANYLRD